jgi:uncharacterized membrane protein
MRNSGRNGFSWWQGGGAWFFGTAQWLAALALALWLLAFPPVFGLYYPAFKTDQDREDARAIVDWLAGGGDLNALQAAVLKGHLSQKELDHFADVRALFRKMPLVFGTVLIGMIALLAWKKPSREWFWAAQKRGLIVFAGALFCLAVLGVWNWKLLFAWVHYPFFGATSWKLPNSAYSLQLFPMFFWQVMSAVFLAAATLVSGALALGLQRLVPEKEARSVHHGKRKRPAAVTKS